MFKNTENLQAFYFSLGTAECFPYERGHIKVIAPTLKSAINAYKQKYPFSGMESNSAVVNCAYIYSEEEWEKIIEENPSMQPCHDVLIVENIDISDFKMSLELLNAINNQVEELGWK